VTAKTLPCVVERMPKSTSHDDVGSNEQMLRFIIKEGRNRQIRRMCSALELEVTSLHRVAFAGIKLGGCELPGQFTDLTKEELSLIGRGPSREERRTPEEREQRKLKKLNKKRNR